MKTSTVNLHSVSKKLKVIKFNWLLILLIILFITGLIIGSFEIKSSTNIIIKKIIESFETYLKNINQFAYISVFFNTFLISTIPLILAFFIGLSATGVPFVLSLPFLSGLFLGVISGYTYETYLLKGLGFCATNIFPSALITVAALILACEESMKMSKQMLMMCVELRIKKQIEVKKYCIKTIIFISICALGSMVEVVTWHLFSGLFIF